MRAEVLKMLRSSITLQRHTLIMYTTTKNKPMLHFNASQDELTISPFV